MSEQTEQHVATDVSSIGPSRVGAVVDNPRSPRRATRRLQLLIPCAVAVGIPSAALAYFGSFQIMAAYLAGHRVIADCQRIDLGDRHTGEICERTVTIRNFRDVTISVTGVSLSCTCISVSSLPLNIEAGASASFTMHVRVVSKNTEFDQTATFLTNDQTDHGIGIRIRGTLTKTVPDPDRESG